MHHTIENDFLKVVIAEEGAELQSIILKKTGKEHLWQGDATFWPRRAPLLFPIVGRLKNDTMTFKGKEYNMPQHGFARDLHFSVEKMTDQSIVLTAVQVLRKPDKNIPLTGSWIVSMSSKATC
jgi:galactose mutarotase-like enzyme